MKATATFYHAGCPVCVEAEQSILNLVDKSRFDVKVVHLGNDRARIAEAESAGVKSVPALVSGGHALHINFGASLADLRK